MVNRMLKARLCELFEDLRTPGERGLSGWGVKGVSFLQPSGWEGVTGSSQNLLC